MQLKSPDRCCGKEESIVEQLREIRREIDRIYIDFQNLTDEDMLDSCIYELRALMAKQTYLIKKAKAERLHSCRDIFGYKGENNDA